MCVLYFHVSSKGGIDAPSPKWSRNGKLEEDWKGQFFSSEKSIVAYVDFIVESLKCWFEGDQCERHKVAINPLVLQHLGSWLPRGIGGKICSILFLRVWNLCLIANSKFNYLMSQVLDMVIEVSWITQVFRKFLRKRNWLNVYA